MPASTDTQLNTITTVPGPDGLSLSIEVSQTPVDDGGPLDNKTRSGVRVFAILTALYLSLFIAALDATIVATAIPTITAHLHSAEGYVWIGGAYLLANAAAGPLWAKLSDIWGRKPIFLISTVLFLVSSMICALAQSMSMLIIGRSLQGTAGGGLIVMVNITISDLFSVRQRSLYLGFCEFVWALAGGVGPIIGGALCQLASWRWCFWINLPVTALAFALLLVFLDVHNPRTGLVEGVKAIDWLGSISILGLTLMLLLGLDFGGAIFPWSSPKVICLIVFGALMSIAFIYSEKRLAEYPLMPLKMFKDKSNTASVLVTCVHGFVFMAGEYYLPLYFQSAKAASPLHSGILLLPLITCTALMGVGVGVLIHRTGRFLELMWIGTALLALGTGLYINLDATSSVGKILGFQIVAGLGSGFLFEPPLIALQSRVAQDDTATATSTLSFVRGLSLAVSVVIGGVVFQNSISGRASHLRAAGLPANITEALTGKNAAANVNLIHTLQAHPEQQMAVRAAFAWSMRNMWILYTSTGFLGILASSFVRKQYLVEEHTETVTGLKKKIVG